MTAYDASSGVPLEEPRDGRTLGQIVGDISQDLTTLVRQEMDLAKTELRQEAQQAGKGIGMLAGAAVTALLMLIFLSWALTWLLDNWMPVELAALITALIWAVVTGVLASMGRTKLREANPQLPADTTDTQGGRSMGTSTEELSSDIAQTRQSLTQDVDALQDRVSPSAIIERRKTAVRGRLSTVKDRVMGGGHDAMHGVSGTTSSAGDAIEQRVEGSPLAAGLIAFGAGLVIAGLIPASKVEARAPNACRRRSRSTDSRSSTRSARPRSRLATSSRTRRARRPRS